MKKFWEKAGAALLLTVFLTACGGNGDGGSSGEASGGTASVTSPESSSEGASAADSLSGTLTDLEGKTVQKPEKLERIISASPSNTEILVGLGLKDKIVAADSYSSDAGIDASLATLDMMNLNTEVMLSLEPDVLVLNGISQTGAENPYSALEQAGVNVVYLPTASSLQEIMDGITFLSEYTGTEEKGSELVGEIEAAIEDAKAKAAAMTEKKTVYFETSPAPSIYTAGSGTYVNEIIELVGGENIFAGQEGWLSASEEDILALNPQVMLSNVNWDGYDLSEVYSRPGWGSIQAVANQAVFYVDSNAVSRPSQNVVKGIEEIGHAIYPEVFQ